MIQTDEHEIERNDDEYDIQLQKKNIDSTIK